MIARACGHILWGGWGWAKLRQKHNLGRDIVWICHGTPRRFIKELKEKTGGPAVGCCKEGGLSYCTRVLGSKCCLEEDQGLSVPSISTGPQVLVHLLPREPHWQLLELCVPHVLARLPAALVQAAVVFKPFVLFF